MAFLHPQNGDRASRTDTTRQLCSLRAARSVNPFRRPNSQTDANNILTAFSKEILSSDAIHSGHPSSPHAQLYADYVSEMIDVFPMTRRTQVPDTFKRFCARWWTPLLLLMDGAAENTGTAMEQVCVDRSVAQIFRTPGQTKVAVQNFSERASGHICRKASFALVYSGATIRCWVLALEAACFVDRLTAHWYSALGRYSIPYCRTFGQHFPDSGVLQPWGCAALILLPHGDLLKFHSRTTKMIFVSYAPQFPTYTYGFLNAKTGRISHSQDAIFLVNELSSRFVTPEGAWELRPLVTLSSPGCWSDLRTPISHNHIFVLLGLVVLPFHPAMKVSR